MGYFSYIIIYYFFPGLSIIESKLNYLIRKNNFGHESISFTFAPNKMLTINLRLS